MAYDYQKLIDAGYSYGQISDFLGGELGVDVNRLRNVGYQEPEIAQFLSEYEKEEDSLNWLDRNLFAPIDKGWNMLELSANIIGAETGILEKEEAAELIAANVQDIASIPQSEVVAGGLQEIQEAEGFWGGLEAVVTNPAAVIDVVISSLVSSIPALAGFALGSVGGTLAGGAVGTMTLPVIGTVGGGVVGGVAGAAVGTRPV